MNKMRVSPENERGYQPIGWDAFVTEDVATGRSQQCFISHDQTGQLHDLT